MIPIRSEILKDFCEEKYDFINVKLIFWRNVRSQKMYIHSISMKVILEMNPIILITRSIFNRYLLLMLFENL